MADGDDFNRLYERLVMRRTSKKKQVKRVAIDKKDAKAIDAAKLEESKRQAQQKHDANILKAVKRLRLARNLRGFSRLSRCSPHRLAYQLADANEQDECRLLQKYERIKRRSGFVQRHASDSEKIARLEGVTARLFLQRAAAFRPDATTTLEGRHRVIDELLFFSPPNLRFLSRIGYADRGNVVPHPGIQVNK